MCGRMSLTESPSWKQLFEYYDAINTRVRPEPLKPRANISPGTDVPIIAERYDQRRATNAKWGLVPRFAKSIGTFKTFNAQLEGLRALSPPASYRGPLKDCMRCLMPMNAYYEWKDGKPYSFALTDHELFAAAGLWEWNAELNVLSCTMITCEANDTVAPYHDRMPALLTTNEQRAHWLSRDVSSQEALAKIGPYEGDGMRINLAQLVEPNA